MDYKYDLNKVKEYEKKCFTGEIYDCNDKDLMMYQEECKLLIYEYNNTLPGEFKKRSELLKKIFKEIGENCYFEPPIRANFGGQHCHIGNNIYSNFNLTLVDDDNIYIGDNTMIAPNVTICTAAHPILPELRMKGLQYNKPVKIGKCVWIGAGVIILPGVTIGDNSVIGAGSVVTRDIPANSVAYGNPARVRRRISERDKEYYFKDEKIDWDNLKEYLK